MDTTNPTLLVEAIFRLPLYSAAILSFVLFFVGHFVLSGVIAIHRYRWVRGYAVSLICSALAVYGPDITAPVLATTSALVALASAVRFLPGHMGMVHKRMAGKSDVGLFGRNAKMFRSMTALALVITLLHTYLIIALVFYIFGIELF